MRSVYDSELCVIPHIDLASVPLTELGVRMRAVLGPA